MANGIIKNQMFTGQGLKAPSGSPNTIPSSNPNGNLGDAINRGVDNLIKWAKGDSSQTGQINKYAGLIAQGSISGSAVTGVQMKQQAENMVQSNPKNGWSNYDSYVESARQSWSITPGVTSSNTTAETPAGSETKTATSIPSINFFTMLGLKKFSPSDADTNEDNYGAFMPIVIKNTPIFEALGTDIENNITKRFEITLPWAVSEISDSVSVNYSRKWGTENTGAQEIISKVSEGLKNLATHFGLSDSWKSKTDTIATWFTANYDARSLHKSLQLDFVLPITSVPQGKEEAFVRALRMALGTLQGLVYPRAHGFAYPPMVKVTCGGIYQNFKGFVEEVRLTFSETMIPVGNYMLPEVINGSIRFKNIFMYTWDAEPIFGTSANEFCLSTYPQLLFGLGEYRYDDMGHIIGGTHYTQGGSVVFNNNTVRQYDYYFEHSTYAQLRRQEELEKVEKGIQSRVVNPNNALKKLIPTTDKSLIPNDVLYTTTFSDIAGTTNTNAFNNWFSSNITNVSSIFTYGKPMTLTDVLSTVTHNTVTNILSDVYVGNFNLGTFLGRYTGSMINDIFTGNLSSLGGTLADIATNTVRDIGGVYYVGGVPIGQILGSVLNKTTTTNTNNNNNNSSTNRPNR